MKGKFPAKAKSWGLGEAGNGNVQVAVLFTILQEGTEYSTVTWYGSFSEAAQERTIESLRICGWKGDDLSDLHGLDANEVELVIDEEIYEGKVQTKVRWVNRAGGLTLKAPITGDKAKAFAAQMRSKIRAFDAANGAKKPAPTSVKNGTTPASAPPEPPPLTDADIPF